MKVHLNVREEFLDNIRALTSILNANNIDRETVTLVNEKSALMSKPILNLC